MTMPTTKQILKLMNYYWKVEDICEQNVCIEQARMPKFTTQLKKIERKLLGKKGYECFDCNTISDLKDNWIVTENNVRCKICGSSNVYPEDIKNGVELI